MIGENLFDVAYLPRWKEQLYALEQMALPEPWRYKNPVFDRKNTENHILEKYICTIFRHQVIDYQNAGSQEESNLYLCLQSGFVCFHTGLLTKRYKSIYGYLERSRMPGNFEWFLKGFFDDTAPIMRNVVPLPEKPFPYFRPEQWGFSPNLEIRVNTDHILTDSNNLLRIPEAVRKFPNLPILLETGVELARRTAKYFPNIVVPQLFRGGIQYLLPISLTDPNLTDLAMTITPMESYYVGSTCLTLEMAYGNARLLARPTAPWLVSLVE